MAYNHVSANVEQRVVMEFLVRERVKPIDIYKTLQAQYGDETVSHSKTFEWCNRFTDGCMSVNIQQVERLILDNRLIIYHQLVEEIHFSVGTVNNIIHKHLHFWKVSASWVARELSVWYRRLQMLCELKERFVMEGHDFLRHTVTCDKNECIISLLT